MDVRHENHWFSCGCQTWVAIFFVWIIVQVLMTNYTHVCMRVCACACASASARSINKTMSLLLYAIFIKIIIYMWDMERLRCGECDFNFACIGRKGRESTITRTKGKRKQEMHLQWLAQISLSSFIIICYYHAIFHPHV